MSRRYFEEEMRYLHEAGKEFAQAHPAQARYLNIDSVADRDPYVERLFEGFAFLTGRIRERLDDELPQYTEGLFQLLYPHFLHAFPSCSILQIKPRPGMLQESMVIGSGTEVRSGAVGEEGAACQFTTTQPVHLHPIRMEEAALQWAHDGTSSVVLRFSLERGVDFEKLRIDRLRLFFHAEPTVASMMHLFFTRHVRRVECRAGDERVEGRGQEWVRPGGLATDEGLIPYSKYSFPGFRLLQEYFMYRPKFRFVDVHGIERLRPPAGTDSFEIQIDFDAPYPENKRFKTENVRLFCTPIVNLFTQDAEPIRMDHRASEYVVVPSVRYRKSMHVYSVDAVTGIEERTGNRWTYEPYYSFKSEGTERRTFTTTTRKAPSERFETYLALGGAVQSDLTMPVETLSLEITCTNGTLPRERLKEGMITQPGRGVPSVVELSNLTQPSLEVRPPLHEHPEFLWQLLSHLSFNRMSVASPESLRGVLELYEWTGSEANRRRLAGIRNVEWRSRETIHRGAVVRGSEVVIEIDDGHFEDEGDLCLFGLVLSEFFCLYATINSFVDVTIVLMPSAKRFEWPSRKGQLPPI